jgi:predicted transcriptional regulator of viral defense system
MQSIEKRIFRRIKNSKHGSVFSPGQFLDLGNRRGVDVALHRLVKSGRLRRIRQGLYDLPRAHPITGQTAPDAMAVVRVLMADSNAQWQPSGAYAANLLQLSDQVPAKIVILTNGVPRQVKLDKLTLSFRRVSPRNLLGAGRTSGLVIQALRYLGRGAVTASTIARLRSLLDGATKRDLDALASKTPAWMRPVIKQVTAAK